MIHLHLTLFVIDIPHLRLFKEHVRTKRIRHQAMNPCTRSRTPANAFFIFNSSYFTGCRELLVATTEVREHSRKALNHLVTPVYVTL